MRFADDTEAGEAGARFLALVPFGDDADKLSDTALLLYGGIDAVLSSAPEIIVTHMCIVEAVLTRVAALKGQGVEEARHELAQRLIQLERPCSEVVQWFLETKRHVIAWEGGEA